MRPLHIISGEGPNQCSCGHEVPGTNHFEWLATRTNPKTKHEGTAA